MGETRKSVDRETLYKEVWADPVIVVATRYGLSDVGLAKICRSLAIPLPSRGYWAKVKAGKVMRQAPLPEIKQNGPVATRLVPLPPEQAAVREAARKTAARVRKEIPPMPSAVEASPMHPLVLAAAKRLRQRDGWPEGVLLRSAPKEVLNLSVTRGAVDRAILITDALVKALAQQGFEFWIDPDKGVTLIRWLETGTQLTFSLTENIRRTRHEVTPAEERARKRYWDRSRLGDSVSFPQIPMYDYDPTGVLMIQVGHWPSRSWKDTPRKQLEQRLGEVTGGVLALAQETHAKDLETARREEAHRCAVARYEFFTKRRADEVERLKQLEAQVSGWERAGRLRAYANAVEEQAKAAGEVSGEQRDWLDWVRAKADWLDPLVLVSDAILDAPEPKRPGYW